MNKGLRDSLVIDTGAVSEDGVVISEEFTAKWLDNIPEYKESSDTKVDGPIRVEGRVTKEAGGFRVKGNVDFALVTSCTRCGGDAKKTFAGGFDLIFMEGKPANLPKDLELSPEDADSLYFDGPDLDLNPVFKQEVAVQIPVQILCRKDCKGLCSSCGADLNNVECDCEKEEGDPRLAVLRNLKIN
jgi:DUF177 domain-containing protein